MQGNETMDEAKGKSLDKGKEVAVPDAQQTTGANFHPYPTPLAKYEEVIADRKLFRETLEKLHVMMGTKFMIPIIGGRDLDLHQLFTEVTSRGGHEKVGADRRWREVTAMFNFPSTATNASFTVRKYYLSLLHHYEQIYFFGSQGWSSSALSITTPHNHFPPERLTEFVTPYSETQATLRKRGRNYGQSSTAHTQVVGVIDGKFESGYFVTVTVGSAKLRGVIYHIPTTVQVPELSGIADDSNCKTRRRRRRKKLCKRDPSHPKPNRSGYNFFFAEQHPRLKPAYPGRERDISKTIGELWNKLSETEKAVYQEKGLQDKERYQREMAVYKERQKEVGQVISNAVPIQQLPPEQSMIYANPKRPIVDVDLALTNEHDSGSGDDDDEDDDDDSEDKISHGDSEIDTSPGVGGNGTQDNSSTGQFMREGCISGQSGGARLEDHTVREGCIAGQSDGARLDHTMREGCISGQSGGARLEDHTMREGCIAGQSGGARLEDHTMREGCIAGQSGGARLEDHTMRREGCIAGQSGGARLEDHTMGEGCIAGQSGGARLEDHTISAINAKEEPKEVLVPPSTDNKQSSS